MKHQEVKDLHNEYCSAGRKTLDFDQFSTLVMFFPSLLVVLSDDHIDDEEWVFVSYLAKFMSDTFKHEIEDQAVLAQLQEDFFQEAKYLLQNAQRWEEKFLTVLKGILERHPDLKLTILEILLLFAEASEGTSDHEEAKIEEIKQYLNIDEDFE